MDSGYQQKENENRIAKTKILPKTSSGAAPNVDHSVDHTSGEKWRAKLAKIVPPEWLDEKVLDWAEDEDSGASLALTCPIDE